MDPREAIGKFMAAMEAMKDEDLFTEEGWQKCVDALQFIPEQQRAGFLGQFVLVATQM